MIDGATLRSLADELRVYDVDEGAWEQESAGTEGNLAHVQLHLARDLSRKDFTDRDVAVGEILPDSLAYALRIARWCDLSPEEFISGVVSDHLPQAVSDRYSSLDRANLAWLHANVTLADALHGLDHEREREKALADLLPRMRTVGSLLVFVADVQSFTFKADVQSAFTRRLDSNRKRFGIG